MKTIENLENILPDILDLFSQREHEFGECEWSQDEDGWSKGDNFKSNCFIYDEDGWYVEVNYECCGEFHKERGDYWNPPCYDLIRAWGEVSSIIVSHCDKETGEESDFSEDELDSIIEAFNEEIKNIA